MEVDFRKIIEKLKAKTGWTQKEIAANIFGITDKNLSNRIKRNSIDFVKLIEWGVNNNVDLNWFLADQAVNEKGAGSVKSTEGTDEDLYAWMNYLLKNDRSKLKAIMEFHEQQGFDAWVQAKQETDLPLKKPPQKKIS